MPRIVFMGTPKFASDILEGLLEKGFNIIGAVCQPDKEVGRKHELKACEVKQKCLDCDIKVLSPDRIRKTYKEVIDLDPELIITCAYGQIIPKELLDYPKYGCINTHASLLPKYRGASPIQSAILNGDSISGMSLMYMNEKMDEGDIIAQKQIEIDIHDTNATLFDKMSKLALDMLIEYIPRIVSGDINPIKQDDYLASYTYKLDKDIEHISFNDKTINVYNHIRGLLDNPGCFFIAKNKKYKIEKAFYELSDNVEVNTFKGLENDYLRIDCLDGYIKIYDIKPEGKNSMKAKDFFNGAGRSLIGEKLG